MDFIGAGTVINVLAVVAGALAGMAVGGRLPAHTREVVTDCLGLVTLLMAGLSAVDVTSPALADAVGTGAPVLIVLGSLLIGSIVGSLLRIEERLGRLAGRVQAVVGARRDDSEGRERFVEGWLTASLLFCVGPLTILGTLDDGLGRGIDKLALKSVLDAFAEAPWIESGRTSTLLDTADQQAWTTDPGADGGEPYALGRLQAEDVHPSGPSDGSWRVLEETTEAQLLDPAVLEDLEGTWRRLDALGEAMEDDAPLDADEIPEGFTVDDVVVHQQDVQAVVNALWAAGAEAMTIQDQRVIATSAVRCVGNTLILQGRVYSPPFTITAVGDTAELKKALDDDPTVSIYQQYVDAVGLGYEVSEDKDTRLPAFAGRTSLEHARALDEDE